jgi:prepilin peptidase CpaA
MTQIVVIAAGVLASAIDLRSRRVPNMLTMPLAGVGVLLAAAGIGSVGVGAALGGCLVGLLIMLPLHVLGGTGAGDVKLMAALGTLLGPGGVIGAILRMAIVGGVIAMVVAVQRGRVRETLSGTALLVARVDGVAAGVRNPAMNNRFPYAPAIAIGAAMVAFGW